MSLFEADITSTLPPLISGSTALTFLQDLTHYLHSRPVSSRPPVPRFLLSIFLILQNLCLIHIGPSISM